MALAAGTILDPLTMAERLEMEPFLSSSRMPVSMWWLYPKSSALIMSRLWWFATVKDLVLWIII